MTDFMKCALIRALKTMAQTALAVIGWNGATTMSIVDVDWAMVGGVAALAGVCSIFTSIAAGLPEVDDFDEVAEDPGEEDLDE